MDKKEQIVTYVITLAVAVFVAVGIYNNQIRALSALQGALATELKKNEVLTSINKMEPALSAYKNFLNTDDTSLIIGTITTIAKEMDVKIQSIKPQDKRDMGVYVKYPFSLVIGVTNYHHLGRFISRLETYPDIFFAVDNIKVRSPGALARQNEPKEGIFVDLVVSTSVFKN